MSLIFQPVRMATAETSHNLKVAATIHLDSRIDSGHRRHPATRKIVTTSRRTKDILIDIRPHSTRTARVGLLNMELREMLDRSNTAT